MLYNISFTLFYLSLFNRFVIIKKGKFVGPLGFWWWLYFIWTNVFFRDCLQVNIQSWLRSLMVPMIWSMNMYSWKESKEVRRDISLRMSNVDRRSTIPQVWWSNAAGIWRLYTVPRLESEDNAPAGILIIIIFSDF